MDKQSLRVLLDLLDRPVAFHPALARVAGGVTAGLMLCQLIYWSGKSTLDIKQDNWVKKDWREFEAETALTQDEQRGARKSLTKAGLIRTERRGLDPVLWYQVDFEMLFGALAAMGNSHCGAENSRCPTVKSKSGNAITPTGYTEITSETTSTTATVVEVEQMELHAALLAEARRNGKTDPEAWVLGALRAIHKRAGLGPAEHLALERYRAAQAAAAAAAQQQAQAVQPPKIDAVAMAKGSARLAQINLARRKRVTENATA